MKRLQARGDTIVEVLLAIAVISTVLSLAYVTVRRATNNARQAQERGVATKLLESQAERLKSIAPDEPDPPAASIFTDNNFCLDTSSVRKPVTDGACKVYETGEPHVGGGDVEYRLEITRSGNDFTIFCKWDRAGGDGEEQASISYRIYP